MIRCILIITFFAALGPLSVFAQLAQQQNDLSASEVEHACVSSVECEESENEDSSNNPLSQLVEIEQDIIGTYKIKATFFVIELNSARFLEPKQPSSLVILAYDPPPDHA